MPWHHAGTLLAAAVVGACLPLVFAAPAAADLASDVQAAAHVATDQGYRTGVAVLDLRTGNYSGGGEDTAPFASESVAKVLIATQLLATGQMTGAAEATAYEMITQSDDDAANALYGLAGGDDVINLVAARYQIPFLGTPPDESGWWGNTEITAKGMAYLYAGIARDPAVGPWLMNAMAHTTGDPHGDVSAVIGGSGTITIDGQESDPNGPDPRLEVSVDGAAPIVRSIGDPAYEITVPASPGIHEVTVTYLRSSDGDNVTEGTWAVTVPSARGTRALEASAIAALPTLLLGFVMGYRWLCRVRRRPARP